MPLVNVRLSKDEYDDLKAFAKAHKMGMSEVIRYGISYVKLLHDTKSRRSLKRIENILMRSMQESFKGIMSEIEEKTKEQFQSPEVQEKFKKEIIPELESEARNLAESLKNKAPYTKRRGRPPRAKNDS